MNPGRFNCVATRLALWLFSLVLLPIPLCLWAPSFVVEVLDRVECGASHQEPRLDLIARTALRIVEAESREPDAWYRDDYRIARTTLGFARDGSSIPHVEACYAVLGCHPDQVWARIMARREALIGEASKKFFSEEFFGGVSSPRKPVRSVSIAEAKARRFAA